MAAQRNDRRKGPWRLLGGIDNGLDLLREFVPVVGGGELPRAERKRPALGCVLTLGETAVKRPAPKPNARTK